MTALSIDEKRELLKRHFLLQHMREWDLERLARHSRVADYDAGDLIFRKGDPGESMIVVVGGRVMIGSQSSDGREVVFNIINPGEVFGEIAFLDGKPRSADARALVASQCLVLERRHFLPFLEETPKVAIEMMVVLCQRLRNTTGQVEEATFHDLPIRLAHKLLAFAEHYGTETDRGARIELTLKQTELGAMLNATRESVNRVLRKWARDGVIELDRGAIALVDTDRLAELSGLHG